METLEEAKLSETEKPLNRTIVGWKRLVGRPGPPGPAALNRTIVGWKRGFTVGWQPVGTVTLNRTIVGWKRYH